MRSLRFFLSCLTLFHTTELFYSSMIFFNFLGLVGRVFSLLFIHIQHICAQYCMSSFLETIRNTSTKSIFLRLTSIPVGGISIVSRGIFFVLSGFTNDLISIVLKKPLLLSDGFEIFYACIPYIKHSELRFKSAFFGLVKHIKEAIVGLALRCFGSSLFCTDILIKPNDVLN